MPGPYWKSVYHYGTRTYLSLSGVRIRSVICKLLTAQNCACCIPCWQEQGFCLCRTTLHWKPKLSTSVTQGGESLGSPAWMDTDRRELALAGPKTALARRPCQHHAYEPHNNGADGTSPNPDSFSCAFEFSEHHIEQNGINLSFKLQGRERNLVCKTRE